MVEQGTSPITLNATISGLKFFFDVTLDRGELMRTLLKALDARRPDSDNGAVLKAA